MRIVKAIGAGLAVAVCFFYLGCGGVQVANAAGSSSIPLTITTKLLPSAIAGTPYVVALDATGGTPGYTWSVMSGQLPPGVSLASSTGIISGTPVVTGNYSVGISLSDASTPVEEKPSTVTIDVAPAPIAILISATLSATVHAPYSLALQASGGIAPYTWAISSGSLPFGLSLAPLTGVISGTPKSSGATDFTVSVHDSEHPALNTSKSVMLVVAPTALQITTLTLPAASYGKTYSQSLTAVGGAGAYMWSIVSGNLPSGLSLSHSGIISGTPNTDGLASFTVSVNDTAVPAQTTTASLAIATTGASSRPLTISGAALPFATVGSAFSYSLQVGGGTAPYTWSVTSGRLPSGLTLNSSGTFSGIPTASGTSIFTATAVDSSNPARSGSINETLVVASTPLSISSPIFPAAPVGGTYSQSFGVSGGTAPYTWSITSGNLPAGLTISSSGTISGTTTTSGVAKFTATVTDNSSPTQSASASAVITIAPTRLMITSSSLAGVYTGSSYSQTLQASGGTAPYTWSITSGKLPVGLTLAPSTGIISGIAAASGTSTFTLSVTDSSSPAQVTSAGASIIVAPAALAIATTTLASDSVGKAYSQTLQATGGTSPYTWSLSSGSLPAGLNLSATGVISGAPTTSTSSTFSVLVTDSSSPAQTQSATLAITAPATSQAAPTAAPLTIVAPALPSATMGAYYSGTLVASGGTPAYTWSISSGSLPAGLTLAATTGTISGTPTTSGTFSFTAIVMDNESPAQSQSASASITVATATQTAGAGHTWYVDAVIGGTRYSSNVTSGLCDGTADTAPVGTTPNQHCAFADVRMLYQDGSYVTSPSASFPGWGWLPAGGDTVYIMGSVGSGISYGVGPNNVNATCDATGCWGIEGDTAQSGMPAPPSGTSAAHTKIYGGCVLTDTCDATNLSSLTELYGTWGVNNVLSLYGTTYVDVEGFSITDHANCGEDTDYYPCVTNGIIQQSFAKNGIQLFNTTTNTTLTHVRVHGLGSAGMLGAVGDGFTATDLQILGNADSGWNSDDGSGNTGVGHTLVQNFSISWNGCVEEYPIVDSVPYFSCTDQSTGGYGDGFGTATVASQSPGWQVHFDNGIASYNTQDGLDALHISGTGSTMTDTRVLAYGNEGQQLKVGGATATIQNSVIVGNCEAISSQVIPGRPVPTNDSLGAACRAGNTAVLINVTPGDPAYFQNNTIYEAGTIGLEVEYATNDAGSTNTLAYNNNIFVGFYNASAEQYATPIYSNTNLNMLTNPGASWTNNATYGQRSNWTCPEVGESNAVCGNPGLVDETYHPYGYGNMAPASSGTAVVGAGVAIPAITLDYTGYTRPNPPSIGAYEYQP